MWPSGAMVKAFGRSLGLLVQVVPLSTLGKLFAHVPLGHQAA